ncbi:MAG TPA: enoyl-CoA hydratase-related protein [Stellaceae bacterium]|nr:enoyl-CoA hydratase-related protein [Stellaceae bacterium]
MSGPVHIERRGAVLEVTLDRPPVNAITDAVSDALYRAFCILRDDRALRVGILTGAGSKIFSAGWDLKEVAKASSSIAVNDAAMLRPGGFAGFTEFWDLGKPVIAAVNGAAVGGGFELALAATLVIAAENAEFWLPEMQRGFVPDAGAVQRLPRRIPYNIAMELLLTGRRMGAHEAMRWGLVSAVVPQQRLLETARSYATEIAKGAPLAVRALLEAVPALLPLWEREAFDRLKTGRSGIPAYEAMLASEDFLEGPRAFAEKREPVWRGR